LAPKYKNNDDSGLLEADWEKLVTSLPKEATDSKIFVNKDSWDSQNAKLLSKLVNGPIKIDYIAILLNVFLCGKKSPRKMPLFSRPPSKEFFQRLVRVPQGCFNIFYITRLIL
jgi:hypothetical protein